MLAVNEFGFNAKEIKYLIINGFKSAFLPHKNKVVLIKSVMKELEDKGLNIVTDYMQNISVHFKSKNCIL